MPHDTSPATAIHGMLPPNSQAISVAPPVAQPGQIHGTVPHTRKIGA